MLRRRLDGDRDRPAGKRDERIGAFFGGRVLAIRHLGLGKKGERIVYVRTLLGDGEGEGRQVERVSAGQYL